MSPTTSFPLEQIPINTEQHPAPLQDNTLPEAPFIVKAIGNLGAGALSGYIIYWIQRGMLWAGFFEASQPITALPWVLSGLAGAAIVETAKLTHLTALAVIGERSVYENLKEGQTSLSDRLRSHSWKVIAAAESVEQRIDGIYSSICGIRTKKEIQEQSISDQRLYFLEILRLEFWNQIGETMSTSVPQEMGMALVKAAGYTIVGGQVFIWLHGLQFVNGLISKVGDVYKKNEEELIALEQEREKIHKEVDAQLQNSIQMTEEEDYVIIDNLKSPALQTV